MRRLFLFLALASAFASAQNNPFKPPAAKIQVAPVPTVDLQHLKVVLDIDYPNRTIHGSTFNTVAALRDGQTEVKLHAGERVTVDKVSIEDRPAEFTRSGGEITIKTPALGKGKTVTIRIDYTVSKGGARDGWHWIEPNGYDPKHVGFWTQGETGFNREWAPTWDYPNDFTTSETITTVDKDWTVVANGVLIGDTVDGDRRTWHWKQDQPHATYLASLVGGPLDVKKSKWRDVELWYVTPGGKGKLIDPSFDDTPAMLDFFSERVGVKYPWPKYAQNAMIDFGGGMENVSSTTLGADSLTDGRDAYRAMASLNSHELGHQWFGDLVTCKDWGHIWLNESFATIMQWLYFEHSQGLYAYQREVSDGVVEYLGESRRYKRPLATNLYSDPEVMFDSHTYPKGGAIMHTLRRQIGDSAFFGGLKRYLENHRHQPVESDDLCREISAVAKKDLKPFWDQWIYKPGHPVLEYDWTYASGNLTVNVKQTQDTTQGTPIYDIPAKFAAIVAGKVVRHSIRLNAKEQSFTVKSDKPDAVILDPDLDFLREMHHQFQPAELAAIMQFAPNAVDRQIAFSNYTASDNYDVNLVKKTLLADTAQAPAIRQTGRTLDRAADFGLDFWKHELVHKDFTRRAIAVQAIGRLPRTDETRDILRGVIDPRQVTPAVVSAIDALDAKTDREALLKAAAFESINATIKRRVYSKLAEAQEAGVLPFIFDSAKSTDTDDVSAAISALEYVEPSADTRTALTRVLELRETNLLRIALRVLGRKPDPELKPVITKVSEDANLPNNIRDTAKRLLSR